MAKLEIGKFVASIKRELPWRCPPKQANKPLHDIIMTGLGEVFIKNKLDVKNIVDLNIQFNSEKNSVIIQIKFE